MFDQIKLIFLNAFQELDSILKFVVTLVFPKKIATPLVSANVVSRSAHNVARTEDDA